MPSLSGPPAAPSGALAAALDEIAALLRAARADRFRVRAYTRAARVARAAPVDLGLLDPAALQRLDGIGPAMAALIAEHARTGGIGLLEQLRGAEPPGFGTLLQLPLIGARDARRLAGLGLVDLPALRRAAAAPAPPDGLDERLHRRLGEALRRLPAALDPRLPHPRAREAADALATALLDHEGIEAAHSAGSLRRGADLVASLDLVVLAPRRTVEAAARDAAAEVLTVAGPTIDVMAGTGHHTRLRACDPQRLGAAMLAATGPAAHLALLGERARPRGLDLSADGPVEGRRPVPGRTEEEVYAALDLPWIPPELRDDPAVDQRAALPDLVRVGDLRGDLHVHSDFSGDGVDSVEEMVRGAAGRGYDYLALADHAENLTINGMPREAVLARRRTIEEVQQRHPHVRILDAAELNIDLDGSLDYDLAFLLDFDLGVASVHSHMDRDAAAQTERVLTAIAHPAVHVIGHPTGRIIGRRPGYAVDLTAIAQAAAETGTALEVNGSPSRLDLGGTMARAALAAGAVLSLSSDAHRLDELGQVAHAVVTARHGWAEADDVLNTRDLAGLLAFTGAAR